MKKIFLFIYNTINFFLFKFNLRLDILPKYDQNFFTEDCILNYELKKKIINHAYLNFQKYHISKKFIIECFKKYTIHKFSVKPINGGVGFYSGFNIYLLVKIIKPDIIYESGVYRGFTSEVLNISKQNHTKIFSFDISSLFRIYKPNNITFIKKDISFFIKKKSNLIDKRILFFFDDHVSHASRLSLIKRFKNSHVIFDDNYNFMNILGDDANVVPTISMIMSKKKVRTIKYFNKHNKLKIKKINFKLNLKLKKYIKDYSEIKNYNSIIDHNDKTNLCYFKIR